MKNNIYISIIILLLTSCSNNTNVHVIHKGKGIDSVFLSGKDTVKIKSYANGDSLYILEYDKNGLISSFWRKIEIKFHKKTHYVGDTLYTRITLYGEKNTIAHVDVSLDTVETYKFYNTGNEVIRHENYAFFNQKLTKEGTFYVNVQAASGIINSKNKATVQFVSREVNVLPAPSTDAARE